MPREKDAELWTVVSGLLAPISRAYCNFSLWHHEFIKATVQLQRMAEERTDGHGKAICTVHVYTGGLGYMHCKVYV